MRMARIAVLIAITGAVTGEAQADDKPMIPAGAIPVNDARRQPASQIPGKSVVPVPKPMTQSRSGISEFFRRLFGPSQPKVNGTVIQSAQTYKNGITPLPPVVPR